MSTSFTNVPTLGQAVLALSTDSSLLDQGLSSAEEKAKRLGSRLELAIAGAGVAAFGLATKSAIDFESAFTGVRKTVDASEAEFKVLEQGLRNMAKDIPVSATGLAKITETAGQLGIENENLLSFTRTMADLNVATNLTGEAAAMVLARFANITNMDQSMFGNLGSAIVDLGNKFATTEYDITQFALRLAGAGEISGLTEADILAIGTAMSAVGVEAEAGGTALQKVLLAITQSVADGGERLDKFAEVAGMSSSQFAKMWKDDAGGAFTAFVEGLGLQGQNAFATLEELDFHDQRLFRSFLSLAGAGDLLARTMEVSNQAFIEGTALTIEAERRYATTASQLSILKNNAVDVGITFGSLFLPAIKESSQAMADFLGWFGDLPESSQQMLLLGITVLAVGPKFLSLMRDALKTFSAIDNAAAASRLKMIGFGVGVTAAIVGLDLLVNKLSGGYGLVDVLTGAAGKAKYLEAATRDLEARFYVAGENVDTFTTSLSYMNEALQAEIDLERLRDPRIDQNRFEAAKALREQESAVRAAAKAMKDSQVDSLKLAEVYGTLSGEAKKWFDAETNIVAIMATKEFALKSAQTATDGWSGSLAKAVTELEEVLPPARSLIDQVGAWGPVLDALDSQVEGVFSSWRGEIPPTAASLEGLTDWLGETFGPEAQEVFEDLLSTVEDTFGGIVDAYDSLLPEADETFAKWKQRLIDMAEEHSKFKGSLQTIWDALVVSGVAMPEALLSAIAQRGPTYANNFAKWFADDPEAALEVLKTNAPVIMGTTTDNIVKEVVGAAPEMNLAVHTLVVKPWQAAKSVADLEAQKVAVSMHESLIAGVLNPAELTRTRTSGSTVGYELSMGVMAGITMAQASGVVQESARGLVRDVISAMKSEAQTQSPSLITRDEVGLQLGLGIAQGLYASQRDVSYAAESVINTALDTIRTGWTKVSDELGGGTVPDWVIANSPYLSQNSQPKGMWSAGDPSSAGTVPTGAYGKPLAWDEAIKAWVNPWEVGSFGSSPKEWSERMHAGLGNYVSPTQEAYNLYKDGLLSQEQYGKIIEINNYGNIYSSDAEGTLGDLGWGLQQELGARGVW